MRIPPASRSLKTSHYLTYCNEVYILSGPIMKHGRPEAHSSLSQSGLYWFYFCRKNDVICYVIEQKVMSFVLQKRPQNFMLPNWFFLIICNLFWSTIFWSGAKQRFCFSEIYHFINQSGIPYLSIVHIMACGNFIIQQTNP